MNQFNFRIGNIEARTAYHRDTVEIVQWDESRCWTIVSFIEEGDPPRWKAIFENMSPLDRSVNWKHLRELIKACYDYLNGEEQA